MYVKTVKYLWYETSKEILEAVDEQLYQLLLLLFLFVFMGNFVLLQQWFLFVFSLQNNCCETYVFTWLNVFSNNADVFISVRPCVFVPESNHMTQFMHHNSKLVAVFSNWYGLRPTSATTHVGAAPMNE